MPSLGIKGSWSRDQQRKTEVAEQYSAPEQPPESPEISESQEEDTAFDDLLAGITETLEDTGTSVYIDEGTDSEVDTYSEGDTATDECPFDDQKTEPESLWSSGFFCIVHMMITNGSACIHFWSQKP